MPSYEMVKVIGRGGFGVVEEVKGDDGLAYARKTFCPALNIHITEHEKLRKRFKREVRVQAELGGREILPVLDCNLDIEKPWFVMPLAESTYEQQIEKDRKSGCVNIEAIADILNGLEQLHELAFVHRDLNPKNVLFHEGTWKLSDLGAVLPPSGHTVTLTEDTVIYTERYCAPEQRNDFHSAQPSSDIYSFGCMLHDIFGVQPRIPYSKQTAEGPVGMIIEKCTETTPARRPTVKTLRGMLLETLVDIEGHCKVADQKSAEWLERLKSIGEWSDGDFGEFARFFAQLDIEECSDGHEQSWVGTPSTPFLTHVPVEALIKIVNRDDGISTAIIEKYCTWTQSTDFRFHFADIICASLTAIVDNGTPAVKAMAMVAIIRLAESHNRWYVMRCMLFRCRTDQVTDMLAKRYAIEIRTEELEHEFHRCASEVDWDISTLAPVLRTLLE